MKWSEVKKKVESGDPEALKALFTWLDTYFYGKWRKDRLNKEGGHQMSFEGFVIGWTPEPLGVPWETYPAKIECEKCGTITYREQGYMRDTCDVITCHTCGHEASRKYTELRLNDNTEESVIK